MSEDTIKREDAIKVAKAFLSEDDDWFQEALASQIRMIPSADRPQGEWIYTDNPLRLDDEWACSRCGNISFVRTNFCDRCGARMKGADNDSKRD